MTDIMHGESPGEVFDRHADAGPATLVRSFLDYFSRGDAQRAFSLMSVDATWWVAGRVPGLSGTRSRTEFRAMLERLTEEAVGGAISLTPTGWTVSRDRVAVEVQAYAEFLDGRVYENEYHFLFSIRGDQIESVKAYLDTERLRDTFLDSGARWRTAKTEGTK